MPKLVAENLSNQDFKNMTTVLSEPQDAEAGGSGPVLSWQNVGMHVGSKQIL
jgi:hypothetical protein